MPLRPERWTPSRAALFAPPRVAPRVAAWCRRLLSLLLWLALLGPAAPAQKALTAQGKTRLGGVATAPTPCKDPGPAALLPANFSDQPVGDDWNQAVGLTFDANGRMFVWERGGVVWTVVNGVRSLTPFLDISDEVGSWADHGLHGFALDPNFLTNGWVYLLYVADRHHVEFYGTPSYDPQADDYFENTIGRLTRYRANPLDGFQTVLPNSREVMIGQGFDDGIPICDASYGTGTLRFGEDGSLLIGSGDAAHDNIGSTSCLEDGLITAEQDVGIFRAQVVDSMTGKILRVDPATGDGLPSNPFYEPGTPDSSRSRVWTLGVRQPFRFTVRPGSGDPDPSAGDPGTLYLGDVGQAAWEELDIVSAGGANLGWPIFEGMDTPGTTGGTPTPNLLAPNPLFGQLVGGTPCTQQFFDFEDLLVQDTANAPSWPNPCDPAQQIALPIPTYVHLRPTLDWFHLVGPARVKTYDPLGEAAYAELGSPSSPVMGESFDGNCSIGGTWYTGTAFPSIYRNTYFHADYGGRWIRNFVFGANDEPLLVDPFAQAAGSVVFLTENTLDGALYYIDFNGGTSRIRRISYDLSNQAPVAAATATPGFGPAPLTVQLDGSSSSDAEGAALEYRWTFGDGTPPSFLPNPQRTFPTVDVTALGSVVTKLDQLTPPMPMGLGSLDPEVMRDGVYPSVGATDPLLQYDTFHATSTLTMPDKGRDDWIGYEFQAPQEIVGLVYQEGVRWTNAIGGWFDSLTVQVRDPGSQQWSDVTGLAMAPAYTFPTQPDDLVGFQVFELTFDPVVADGVRLYGDPGGIWDFISVGELRVLARPAVYPTKPVNYDVALTVTDDLGNTDCTTLTLSVNDSPPLVHVDSPVHGTSFSNSTAATVALQGTVSDPEQHASQLACEWQVVLHHDNHVHPEPPIPSCTGSATLQPHDPDPGDVLYYEVRLTVTDPLGLSTSDSAFLYPDDDCNLNGVTDALDIAMGTSLDLDSNGVPDECQTDCNGNGVHDLFDIVLGASLDDDANGIPDECE